MAEDKDADYTLLTVQLLSAYVTNNIVPSNELAALIQSTRAALIADDAPPPTEASEHVPAVSIRKSIASADHILSLIDGRPYKTLKRHLATHGLTPETYRERFRLPKSYPMVAAGYSEQRRAVARKIGLGQRGLAAQAAATIDATGSPRKRPTVGKAGAAKPAKLMAGVDPVAPRPARRSRSSAPAAERDLNP